MQEPDDIIAYGDEEDKSNDKMILKMYIDLSNDSIKPNAVSLQKINDLTSQIKLKDVNINNFKEENEKLVKKAEDLGDEIIIRN